MVLDKFSLEGKTAIVTGAGTGLGKQMAVALAQAGANIVATAHSSVEGLDETRHIVEKEGRQFFGVSLDLSKIESHDALIEKALERFNQVDILVNNAGIIRRSPVLEFTEEDWDQVLDLNLKSLFFLSQKVARTMKTKGVRGKIVNIASLRVFQGGMHVISYSASKGAVASTTRAMANELAEFNINVNAIAPGYMKTKNTAPLQQNPERNAEILNRTPLGRWGQPEDLDGAVVFLSSPASDFITGQILTIDGGWLIR